MQHFDSDAVTTIVAASVMMSNIFIYCYFGQLVTDSYEMMTDCVCNMDWYKQPNKTQKYFILMIANMQKPVYFHGFEITRLDLNTFVNVNNDHISRHIKKEGPPKFIHYLLKENSNIFKTYSIDFS